MHSNYAPHAGCQDYRRLPLGVRDIPQAPPAAPPPSCCCSDTVACNPLFVSDDVIRYKTFVLLHKNKNLQSVLIGRQVFVSAVVVLLSRAGVVASNTTDFFGLPQWFVTVFMRTGILGTLFCVVVGQLTSRYCEGARMVPSPPALVCSQDSSLWLAFLC